jgi:hypothetical protein
VSPLNIPSFHPKNNSDLTVLLCNTLTGLLEAAEAGPHPPRAQPRQTNAVLEGRALALVFRDSAVLNMAGVEHQQPIAAHAVKMDARAPRALRVQP